MSRYVCLRPPISLYTERGDGGMCGYVRRQLLAANPQMAGSTGKKVIGVGTTIRLCEVAAMR